MRITPVNVNYSAYSNSNLSKCRKPAQVTTNQNTQQNPFYPMQDLSFGFLMGIRTRARVKKDADEDAFKVLDDSKSIDIKFLPKHSKNRENTYYAYYRPEWISQDEGDQKEVKKILDNFLKSHPDKFKPVQLYKTALVLRGSLDIAKVANLAKKLKPYEIESSAPKGPLDEIHEHDQYV